MKIYEVPSDRNYWVVRADGGKYYDHFVKHGVMALAHLDILELQDSEGEIFTPGISELATELLRKHESEGIKKGTTTSHFNQIKSFINGVKVGDWVMLIGRHHVHFGRVTSRTRLARTDLEVRYGKEGEHVVRMPHNLRRSVAWGPSLKRDTLPYVLLSSMRAYQAIFNVNQHWEAIHHTLYSVFRKEDELFFSIKINSKDKINNYHVTSLLSYLNEIEVIAKYANEETGIDNFDAFFREYAMAHGVSTTTKAAFHSPGEIWSAVETGLRNHPIKAMLLGGYILLFGNNLLGFDGIIDLETRQKAWEIVFERHRAHQIEDVARHLKLTQPRINTDILESDSQDEVVETHDI